MIKTPSSTIDMDSLTREELAAIVYHIGANTRISKQYTREFIEKSLLKASEMLSMDTVRVTPHPEIISAQSEYEGPELSVLNECADELHDFPESLCPWHTECNHPTNSSPCTLNGTVECYCCEEGRKVCRSKQSHH